MTETFNTVANLVKTKRIEHPACYSQRELANLLGFKGEDLIVSIENAERNIPLKVMPKLAKVLNVHPDVFIEAVMTDHKEYLDKFFSKTFENDVLCM